MAEAHQAVAFQFKVTDEGISVHFDRRAVKASLGAVRASAFKTFLRIRASVLRGVFPASPVSLVVLALAVFALHVFDVDTTYGALSALARYVRGAGWVGGRVYARMHEGARVWWR